MIGGGALWRHGWTTQIHRMPEWAVSSEDDAGELPQGRILPRAPQVFSALLGSATDAGGWLLASPAHALADALLSQGNAEPPWLPAADDLDADAIRGARPLVIGALRAMGGSERDLPEDLAAVLAMAPERSPGNTTFRGGRPARTRAPRSGSAR